MPSPLEQLLGTAHGGLDELKKRMLMQMLLQNPVNEGDIDPTSPYYASGAMNIGKQKQTDAFGGILPDRSGDAGMVLHRPNGRPPRIAPGSPDVQFQELRAKLKAFQDRG